MVDNFRILYCFLHKLNLIHHVDDEWCQTIDYQYTRQTCKRLEEKTGLEEDYTSLDTYSIENNSIYHFLQFSSRIFSRNFSFSIIFRTRFHACMMGTYIFLKNIFWFYYISWLSFEYDQKYTGKYHKIM